MSKPTQADLALDLVAKLNETEQAISYLRMTGNEVPDEAHEIAGILRRAIAAEREREGLLKVCETVRMLFDMGLVETVEHPNSFARKSLDLIDDALSANT